MDADRILLILSRAKADSITRARRLRRTRLRFVRHRGASDGLTWHWVVRELIGVNRNGKPFLTRHTFRARRGEWLSQFFFKVVVVWGAFAIALYFLVHGTGE